MAKKKVSKKKVAKKVAAKKAPCFVFVGNGDSDPHHIRMFGHDFELNGKAVEVDDPARFVTHTHFKAG